MNNLAELMVVRSIGGRLGCCRNSAVALGLVIILSAPPANAVQLPGTAVRIVDGDTIVLKVAEVRHRVRLAGIDAPEKNQPWGEASTRELRRQIAGKHVVVELNRPGF